MWMLLFPFGGVIFWIYFVAVIIGISLLFEYECGKSAFFSFLLAFAVVFFLTDMHTRGWSFLNYFTWWQWLAIVAGYFVLGFCWARLKFQSYVYKVKQRIQDLQAEFLEENANRCTVGRGSLLTWEEYRSKYGRNWNLTSDISFDHCSGKILKWATYWPLSLIGTLLNDPIRKAFKYIYVHYLLGAFRRCFQKHVNDVWNTASVLPESEVTPEH